MLSAFCDSNAEKKVGWLTCAFVSWRWLILPSFDDSIRGRELSNVLWYFIDMFEITAMLVAVSESIYSSLHSSD